MRIIFFGSGKFAVTILKALHVLGYEIPLIVTQPDRKKGRHLYLSATPVKEYAISNNFSIFQPEDINSKESCEFLLGAIADIFIVVSYGKILARQILDLPNLMPVNIHASLLPKYRGAAPISRALMAGEKQTGVTFIKMNESMDKGDIIFQKSIRIDENDNAVSLDEKLSNLSSEHLDEILKQIEKKQVRLKKQDNEKATYAPVIKKSMGLIQWDMPVERVLNYFKGCYGWPGSFTYHNGKLLKILSLEKGSMDCLFPPAQILSIKNDALEVSCGIGSVLIKEVLPESHHRMSVKSFLSGHSLKIGEKLG